VASFTYACTDLNCTFDGSGSSDSDGTIVQWAWSFGDGMTGDGEKTSHSFTAAGSYVVALTVHDNDGDIYAIDQQVDVTVTPVQPPVVTPAVPVPTMSAWGKLGMVFVLMFAGLGYTRRYKK
jgi:PKD repeat protein